MQVNPTGLAAGTYSGTIAISATINFQPVTQSATVTLTITTTPPGAKLILDDEEIGVSPLTYRGPENKGVAFYIDPQTSHWNEYKLRVAAMTLWAHVALAL